MSSSDPFDVCRLIVLMALYFATLFGAVCTIECVVHGLTDGMFYYGIGTILTGSGLKWFLWRWFSIEG